MTYYISFPGFRISPFYINRVAFTIFGREVMWYGILITLGIILAFFYALSRAKIEKISLDDMLDFALITVITGMIGARLYYVIFKLNEYIVTDRTFWENLKESFLRIISIWNGGIAIYGSIIAGFIAIFFIARRKHIKFPVMLDIIAPAVMIGQIIGRWGNFINIEAYGSKTTLPWRMGIIGIHKATGIPITEKFVHPTFLYELFWNLIGLLIIHMIYKKKKFNGEIFFIYISWYGFGRMLIEGLRTDSLMLGPFRVSQIIGFLSFIIGGILLIINLRKSKKHEPVLIDKTPEENKFSTKSNKKTSNIDNGENNNPNDETKNAGA